MRRRAGRIVGVQCAENQVARERGLHGDFRRLAIADFADQTNVGIVTKDRPQTGAEGQAGFGVHLNLIDAAKLIFDRVFDRDDFQIGLLILDRAA